MPLGGEPGCHRVCDWGDDGGLRGHVERRGRTCTAIVPLVAGRAARCTNAAGEHVRRPGCLLLLGPGSRSPPCCPARPRRSWRATTDALAPDAGLRLAPARENGGGVGRGHRLDRGDGRPGHPCPSRRALVRSASCRGDPAFLHGFRGYPRVCAVALADGQWAATNGFCPGPARSEGGGGTRRGGGASPGPWPPDPHAPGMPTGGPRRRRRLLRPRALPTHEGEITGHGPSPGSASGSLCCERDVRSRRRATHPTGERWNDGRRGRWNTKLPSRPYRGPWRRAMSSSGRCWPFPPYRLRPLERRLERAT